MQDHTYTLGMSKLESMSGSRSIGLSTGVDNYIFFDLNTGYRIDASDAWCTVSIVFVIPVESENPSAADLSV
jgi:hypothetical protein